MVIALWKLNPVPYDFSDMFFFVCGICMDIFQQVGNNVITLLHYSVTIKESSFYYKILFINKCIINYVLIVYNYVLIVYTYTYILLL